MILLPRAPERSPNPASFEEDARVRAAAPGCDPAAHFPTNSYGKTRRAPVCLQIPTGERASHMIRHLSRVWMFDNFLVISEGRLELLFQIGSLGMDELFL